MKHEVDFIDKDSMHSFCQRKKISNMYVDKLGIKLEVTSNSNINVLELIATNLVEHLNLDTKQYNLSDMFSLVEGNAVHFSNEVLNIHTYAIPNNYFIYIEAKPFTQCNTLEFQHRLYNLAKFCVSDIYQHMHYNLYQCNEVAGITGDYTFKLNYKTLFEPKYYNYIVNKFNSYIAYAIDGLRSYHNDNPELKLKEKDLATLNILTPKYLEDLEDTILEVTVLDIRKIGVDND